MSSRRRVVIVTGTRAEFGLLRTVLDACLAYRGLETSLIVTGTHLTLGTIDDIRAAGYRIARRVPMQKPGEEGRVDDVRALGRGVTRMAGVFESLRPTFVVVLGDRIEAFAAASAAAVGGFRVAHLHGGDRAEGVADESMRHAISKLAHLHLPATAGSRRRLVRMGETKDRVMVVGSPAMDGLGEVVADGDAPKVMVLQHPVGESTKQEQAWMEATLQAVKKHDPLVLHPNTDAGAEGIRRAIKKAAVKTVKHLPRDLFLSLLAGAGVLVGNSSAGLIEAAALRTPAVNIGPRQAGRERPGTMVDCDYGERAVRAAVRQALALDTSKARHPYGRGDTGVRVAELLAGIDLERIPLRKLNAY
ncbi:MAG: UDP-N-acetylglucosamine 2-epimerase [Phycisphaeraceae bacterium]